MNLPEDELIAPPAQSDLDLPDESVSEFPASELTRRSLVEDFEALIDDGKTYLEAELTYQKTRAAYVADGVKGAVVFAIIAAGFGFLALIGLTVGLIIALTPLLTAWGASAIVVGLMLAGAVLCIRTAGRRWNRLMSAIDTGPKRDA
ncbi:MAG: phage holin family protein [Croceibacterium sp.]